ncbi:MAG: hypothetical protein IKX21_00505, partial [Deltaproteobacteria bacterium]|nr:hypothetical protein [Deltaproteobacteria bacterium]
IVRKAVKGSGGLRVENSTMGGTDPAHLVVKSLLVEYTWNGEKKSATVEEHGRLSLPSGAVVEKALYGLIDPDFKAQPKQVVDLTKRLADLVQDGELRVLVNNEFAGSDPALNIVKETIVTFDEDCRRPCLYGGMLAEPWGARHYPFLFSPFAWKLWPELLNWNAQR